MAGRSYLRRIAQPLAPGDPALAPLRAPRAEEARPPAMAPAPGLTRRQPAPNAAPAPEPALPRDPIAATPAMAQPDADRTARAMPSSAPVDAPPQPAATAAASPSAPKGDRSAPRTQPRGAVEAAREHVVGATATSPRTSIHIGTIEVRTPPATPAPAPPPSRSQRAPSAAPAAPLSRSLTWRYGLSQS